MGLAVHKLLLVVFVLELLRLMILQLHVVHMAQLKQ